MPRPKRDLAADRRTLLARIRAEMHQVTRLLSGKAWEELAGSLPVEAGWTEETLEAAMVPYFAEHPTLDTSPKARRSSLTQVDEAEARLFRVRQTLIDSKGEEDWFIEGVVDLRGRADVDGPLVAVRHIGT
jgi:hypothetical protein